LLGLSRISEFFFSSRRRHTRFDCDWSSDVCSSDLRRPAGVEGVGPAYLVLADTFVPGWTAMLDGRPAPILPAYLSFRAVYVPRRSEERRVGKEGTTPSSPCPANRANVTVRVPAHRL